MSSVANVLVVDDDKRGLWVMRELLQSPTQNLVLASSGAEALRCTEKDDFAVILLDVRMPDVDGFETARRIRNHERSRHTPIIFLTGAQEDLASVFRGYEVGAVDYIVKPIVPEVLKSKIAVFVDLFCKNSALVREIADHKLTEGRLKDSEEALRALATHLQSVREEEQRRIALEIHDELGQALTGLKMDIAWLAAKLPPVEHKTLSKKLVSMSAVIDNTIRSVRKIASGLRPEVLDEVGLAAAIAWQARDFQARTGIRCKTTLPHDSDGLDPKRSTAAFRIFQEVLTNVARHANATRVDIAMRLANDALVLEVKDNGKGIAPADMQNTKSLGLLGMRERALAFDGTIHINGTPGKGTQVTMSIPLRRTVSAPAAQTSEPILHI